MEEEQEQEEQSGPECIICNRKDSSEAFVHSLWLQIDINKLPGPINLIWICPDCLEKTRIVSEYKQSNEDLHHGLKEAGKLMDLLAQLGFLIEKLKVNHFNK